VTEYYDGPRVGIADYQGKPHVYECIFDKQAGNYSEFFRLAPIDDATFQLAMEDWSIWERWELAYRSGKTDIETHPALPEDRTRHTQLKEVLDQTLTIDPRESITRIGLFEVRGNANLPNGVIRNMQVRWDEVSKQSELGERG